MIQIYDTDDYPKLVGVDFFDRTNTFFEKVTIKVKLSPRAVYDMIAKHFDLETVFNFYGPSFYVTDKTTMLVEVYHDTNNSKRSAAAGKYDIYIWSSDREKIVSMAAQLKADLDEFKTNSIVWSFSKKDGDVHTKEIFLERGDPLIKEFYPWLPTDTVQDYFKNYLESSDSILLLTGVPGTGKTTFIRSMILENDLNANLTYDEKLIQTDEFFLDFMDDETMDILIIEDADRLLYDRDENENSILSKILNISDGIVKNVTKKIVFSTNITDIERIDPALIRPGRCYDVLDFRKLTSDEAKSAVAMKNLDREIANRDYTLAELFSTNKRNQRFKSRKFGF